MNHLTASWQGLTVEADNATLATRFWCQMRDKTGLSFHHDSGNNKPTRKKCSYCGGGFTIEQGLWVVVPWLGTGRYTMEMAVASHRSEVKAQQDADKRNASPDFTGEGMVVRWISARDLEKTAKTAQRFHFEVPWALSKDHMMRGEYEGGWSVVEIDAETELEAKLLALQMVYCRHQPSAGPFPVSNDVLLQLIERRRDAGRTASSPGYTHPIPPERIRRVGRIEAAARDKGWRDATPAEAFAKGPPYVADLYGHIWVFETAEEANETAAFWKENGGIWTWLLPEGTTAARIEK